MRAEKYLDPSKGKKLSSLDGKKMKKDFLNLFEIAQENKKNYVLKVMKHNDFQISMKFDKFDPFQGKTPEIDLSEQIKILISCEEDPNKRWILYESWQKARKDKNFNEATFLDEILSDDCSYLG